MIHGEEVHEKVHDLDQTNAYFYNISFHYHEMHS